MIVAFAMDQFYLRGFITCNLTAQKSHHCDALNTKCEFYVDLFQYFKFLIKLKPLKNYLVYAIIFLYFYC